MKNVGCVILAGGFGTRLCPLTDTKPKPLVTILDKTLLENVIDSVRKTTASEIILSTCYKSDMIEALCREKYPDAVCIKEKTPLGTAGGVRNCFDGESDAILVVSGDAVFDFDLQQVIDFHFEKECDVTIVVSRKNDPTSFGVVISDDDGNITGLCEKPAWKNVMSDAVNTGIYVLSGSVAEEIPKNCEYDFSRHLFPRLISENRRIKAFFADGFWCDAGTLDEYFSCNKLAAEGKLVCIPNDGQDADDLRKNGIDADDGIYVSQSAKIGKNVRISEGCAICEGVVVGDNCDIFNSVVAKNSVIGKGCSINGAIIGQRVSVGENCIVPEGAVLGDGCRIADGTVLEKRRHVASERAVFGEDGKRVNFSACVNLFKDDGVAVPDKKDFNRSTALFAKALNRAFKRGEERDSRIAVTGDKDCLCTKNLLCSLLSIDGATVFDCKEGNDALCSFSAKKLETDASVHVCKVGENVEFHLFSRDGSIADTELERKIQKVFSLLSDEDEEVPANNNGGRIIEINLASMYENSLLRYAENIFGSFDLSDVTVTMLRDEISENPSSHTLFKVLSCLNCRVVSTGGKQTLNVSVSGSGRRVKIRYGMKELDHNHACAVILKNDDAVGEENISICASSPQTLRNMKKSDENKNIFCITDDGAVCAMAFLGVIGKSGKSAEELFSDVPSFEIFTDEYVADVNRAATMEKLSKLYHDSRGESDDGIRLNLAEGTVTVVPNRMKGFKIISEASSMEAAKELAVKVGKAIKS